MRQSGRSIKYFLTEIGFEPSQFRSEFSPNRYDSGIAWSNFSPPMMNELEKKFPEKKLEIF